MFSIRGGVLVRKLLRPGGLIIRYVSSLFPLDILLLVFCFWGRFVRGWGIELMVALLSELWDGVYCDPTVRHEHASILRLCGGAIREFKFNGFTENKFV